MLLLLLKALVVTLTFIQDVTGIEKVYPATDDDYSGASSGIYPYVNYSDFSFHHELASLTSNGLVNITTDVVLLSTIPLVGLKNVSIIGHDNPTVYCDDAGGIHFDSCNNCKIIGITWEKCGTKNDSMPAIQLYNSSDIVIQNCLFQNSATQAIGLSEMLGSVSINGCKFVFNNHFQGDGTAIHYSSKIKHRSKFQFTISNCEFTHNGASINSSVVYISPSSNKSMEQVYVTNLMFKNNQGIPMYISHQNVFASGIILFKGNKVQSGGGIFITNQSSIIFQNSVMKYISNEAVYKGGALYIQNSDIIFYNCTMTASHNHARIGGAFYIRYNSNVTFEENSTISINNNQADISGGALYIRKNSNVLFEGNCTVTIKNNKVTQLPVAYGGAVYIRYNSNVTFEGNSTVTIMNNQAKQDGGAFYISHSSNFIIKGNPAVTITNCYANFGGALYLAINCSITFGGSSTITIDNNRATSSGGAFFIRHNSDVTIEGNSTVLMNNNQAKNHYYTRSYGGAFSIQYNSGVKIEGTSTLSIDNNQAHYGGALYIEQNSYVTFEGKSTIMINTNQCKYEGGALYIEHSSYATFKGNSTVMINNNKALYSGGGALYISDSSNVTFEGNTIVNLNNNFASCGGALYIWNSNVIIEENSIVSANNNQAKINGGALYIRFNSNFTFEGTSTVSLNNNQAILLNGGAFYIADNCNVAFERNSTITISNNHANDSGGAVDINDNSNITFKDNASVTIHSNQAKDNGGALYIWEKSIVVFEGNSTVTINNNQAFKKGGAVYINDFSNLAFEGSSTITINNNQANDSGGALYIIDNSNIRFEGSSTVLINSNQAQRDGGGLYITDNCIVTFKDESSVTINNNQVKDDGGAIYIMGKSDVIIEGSSEVTINNNQANYWGGAFYIWGTCNVTFKGKSRVTINHNQVTYYGGALHIWLDSYINFKGDSVVTFNNNTAKNSGGVLISRRNSHILFDEDSIVTFSNNSAGADGGALCGWDNCNFTFKGNSIVMFNNNVASGDGGVMYTSSDSHITFQGNSMIKFNNNKATYFGGALCSKYNSNILFECNCTIAFNNNRASQGGAIFALSDTVFKENSTVQFENNNATIGGALHVSNVTFKGNTMVTFNKNGAALNGGAVYSFNCSITMVQNSAISFTKNDAENGGAIFISTSTLLVLEHSNVTFYKNIAEQDGGAIYFNELVSAKFKNSSIVTLTSNIAENHGGAIYNRITRNTKYFNISEVNFSNNTAKVAGNFLYVDVPKSCNSSCLTDRIVGISNKYLQDINDPVGKKIASSPDILKFHYPAKCIRIGSVWCEKYHITNIMLGQEIIMHPCLLDYYNKPVEVTQFKITGENQQQDYFIHGSKYTSVSCNHTIEGISIVGNKSIHSQPLNYSVQFASYTTHKSVRKIVSVNLTVELTPCHPGFQYHSKSQKCECYNNSGIVSCSGSSSTIARGYWFGRVTGTPTVAFCPISYCNFTCCKTTNGYYHLSPERVNQCNLHRSGTACGSCEEGHTLSLDSFECISVNNCSTGYTILVVTLTVFYWLAVVVTVFVIMYYQVGIGYFYASTYCYSIIDILLNQYTDLSNELYIMVTIMSSTAKVTPQFLGSLCLFKNMSGIDQQFIHYMHPLAVSVILIIISWLVRYSKRLSMFISRGIIRAICFLLLLSYTSVATTSLLLMRSLTFANVDNVYTYLSPDIQYFRGRHLAYGIIAIILALLIVIGLPLLLLLEPFLNGKINLVRIKPLLDQFQGCYKDKYRWFAAYYMICRLVIISNIIANFSAVIISRYLLIIASTIIALIHITVRPYADNVLNICDGAILHLMILITALPLIQYFDAFDSSFAVGIAFVLVILPLVLFVVMKIFISKQSLKKMINNIINHFSFQAHEVAAVSNVVNKPLGNDVNLVIDDSMRRNATICEMYVSSFIINNYLTTCTACIDANFYFSINVVLVMTSMCS